MSQAVIAVIPARARAERPRLFGALERALDVRFEGCDGDERTPVVGELVWAAAEPRAAAADSRAGGQPARTRLTVLSEAEPLGPGAPARLHSEAGLDARLHGLQLLERIAAAQPLVPAPGERVLASGPAGPLWVADVERDGWQRVAAGPEELAEDETLAARLRDGRFLAVLPIVELARRALGESAWTPPPPRACFLFDDPNLHWPSYGHLRFGQLVELGARHGYHVAMATVPVDAWYTHPGARDLFAGHPERLSLIVHGNEHVRQELGRERGEADALALCDQALARIARLERRTGLHVGRIMAPPHGVCSETMAGALMRTGFEAITMSRPPSGAHPPVDPALAGWRPAEYVAGGMPVLARHRFGTPLGSLALHAYLDQPLIVYGHHNDVAGDPDRLGCLCDQLSMLGKFHWQSVQRIARSNASVRRAGELLRVRLHSRRVDVEVPPGVSHLVVELPGHPEPDRERVMCAGASAEVGEPIAVSAGQWTTIGLRRTPEPAVAAGRQRRAAVWPLVRRGIVEARDRSLPMIARLRTG